MLILLQRHLELPLCFLEVPYFCAILQPFEVQKKSVITRKPIQARKKGAKGATRTTHTGRWPESRRKDTLGLKSKGYVNS